MPERITSDGITAERVSPLDASGYFAEAVTAAALRRLSTCSSDTLAFLAPGVPSYSTPDAISAIPIPAPLPAYALPPSYEEAIKTSPRKSVTSTAAPAAASAAAPVVAEAPAAGTAPAA